MIAHKHITVIISLLMAVAVCLCIAAVGFSDKITQASDSGVTMEYESALFNTDSIIDINIIMDDDDWGDMLENATAEEYYQCDVEINGSTYYQVAIRPKGNTSLSSIADDPTTNRYSFKLEFDHYIDDQTCFGLDKLILNNNYADATNMKEALIYDMFNYIGADASLYNYAKISVNGEYWGIYLALEAVEESFQIRNYGVTNGELYKPDSMNIGGGDNMSFGEFNPGDLGDLQDVNDFSMEKFPDQESTSPRESTTQTEMPSLQRDSTSGNQQDDSFAAPSDFSFNGGGSSMNSGGANLNYVDDDPDSYSVIWDGAVSGTSDSDHKRVIEALKNISQGTDLETYMDTDNILRYLAVHIFAVNDDSLSGSMAHNYYLYESDGKLNIIPWDYNLSFGGMSGDNDATNVVNSPIDDAFSITDFFDTLLEDETYHSQYYNYLSRLVNDYVAGGAFDSFYNRVRSQIDALVESDPNSFYDYDEYLAAVDTLYQVVKLRSESIQGQIDGTIPSTQAEQNISSALIAASDIDISSMGSMNSDNKGNNFNFGGNLSPASENEGNTPSTADFSSVTDQSLGDFSPSRPPEQSSADNAGESSAENRDDSDNISSDTSDSTVENIPPDGSTSAKDRKDFPVSDSSENNSSDKSLWTESFTIIAFSGLFLLCALLFALLFRRRKI